MSNWTREAMRAFIERSARETFTNKDEAVTLARNLVTHYDAALAELQSGTVRIPKSLVSPVAADAYTCFWSAAVFSCGPFLDVGQVNFLSLADKGVSQLSQFASQMNITFPTENANDWIEGHVQIPDTLRLTDDALKLASAFARSMLDKAAAEGREPLLGEFVMRKPFDLPLIDSLPFDHIRLVVFPQGVYFSLVYTDGTFSPGWWSPRWDCLTPVFGRKYAWMLRVFWSCFWHDAKVVRKFAFTVRSDRDRWQKSSAPTLKPAVPTIVLPRTKRELTWAEDEKHMWDASRGIKTGYSVRAHYRELHAGWVMSEQARDNAIIHGFPEPPEGYTFVSPYQVGTPEERAARPRLICKGFQAARVALDHL